MYNVTAYKVREGYGELKPLTVNRQWMDDTYDAHAYKCFPVGLTNQMGWGICFPEDIKFIWDGISDWSPDHVKVLEGDKYVSTGRANATISFNTGLAFKTDEQTTLLQMPVPNNFIDGAQAFTTLISTSFFKGELPVAWRITRANEEIIIKAGTPIISLVPIDLSSLQDSMLEIRPLREMERPKIDMSDYSMTVYNINREGKFANFYRNAEDHHGNKLGSHQIKTLKMNMVDNSNV